MISKEQAEQFLNNKLRPVMSEIENLRVEIIENGKRNKLILSGLSILIYLYGYSWLQQWAHSPTQKFLFSAVLIIVLVFVYIFFRPELFTSQSERNRLYNLYKNGVLRESLRYINRTLNYQPLLKSQMRNYEKSKLFLRKITESKELHRISGEIAQHTINISEVQFRYNLMLTFQGWFIEFEEKLDIPNTIISTLNVEDEFLKSNFSGFKASKLNDCTLLTQTESFEKVGELSLLLKDLRGEIKSHVSISVIDGCAFMAIPNKFPFFTVSFRDENNNEESTYTDFAQTVTLFNYLEKVLLCIHSLK
jgi:hypothetical protein